MPYIKKYRRNALDPVIRELASHVGPSREGEANYIITRLLLKIFNHNYKEFNAVLGVLEAVKLEFYSRVVRPYEQEKMEKEGDVYN